VGTVAVENVTASGLRDFARHPLGFARFAAFVVPITQVDLNIASNDALLRHFG